MKKELLITLTVFCLMSTSISCYAEPNINENYLAYSSASSLKYEIRSMERKIDSNEYQIRSISRSSRLSDYEKRSKIQRLKSENSNLERKIRYVKNEYKRAIS